MASVTSASSASAARYDARDPEQLEEGLAAAVRAVREDELVVLPTDTVYGIGADAFAPEAVANLLAAKGRGREMPPPVLVADVATLDALAVGIEPWVRSLVERYWPGALTVVLRQQPSLQWDLGDTRGTVAVRMPSDETALALLARTGPLAVTSANLTGLPAATDADAAVAMLGDAVEVVLDGGPTESDVASTILDCTGDRPRVLREGAIGAGEIGAFLHDLGVELDEDPGADPGA